MRKYPFKRMCSRVNRPAIKEKHSGLIIKDCESFMDYDSCGQQKESRIEHMIEFNVDVLFEYFPELKEDIEDSFRGEKINEFLGKICHSIYAIDIKKLK